ncbi:head-tail connector protein [Acuticoccus sp. M5D2P5]|uniref:head-tail connector protein n=1 Tax=Acuticoccus kalidii TaxID=2910977 RepID=UPI001F178ECF|nr:head-tail connector protein [Acuticoccus kalidii]MCF3933296.1 head-tail connector protein [Acuticoccus kalidii]
MGTCPVRVLAPADTPVTLSEAKEHLRVDHDDEDGRIDHFIRAATEHLDGYHGILGKALITQTWEEDVTAWRGGALDLVVGPLQSVVSLEVVAANGSEASPVDLSGYWVDRRRGRVVPLRGTSVPRAGVDQRILVRYAAGYGDAPSDVPVPIRQAILLLVGACYEQREAIAVGSSIASLPPSFGVHALLWPIRGIFI